MRCKESNQAKVHLKTSSGNENIREKFHFSDVHEKGNFIT